MVFGSGSLSVEQPPGWHRSGWVDFPESHPGRTVSCSQLLVLSIDHC